MLVNLDRISKYYENPVSGLKREVLKSVSLDIRQGDSVAIVGPSGSGKSTLLNILGTLDSPSSGRVLLNGNEIHTLNNEKLSEIRNSKIGFVFQVHHLLSQLNLLENVLLPTLVLKDKSLKASAGKRAMEILDNLGLADKIYQKPGQLSGGECQRTAVARALINQPEMVLADEPTGSLDKGAALQMAGILGKLNRDFGVALVLVTHSSELAEQMGTIFELSDGILHLTKGNNS
ncbi:MAG: ABC transporter ATP-binding protein [Bacteroidales bacterium]